MNNNSKRMDDVHGSIWVSLQDRMPSDEAFIVRVRRKPDAAHVGPQEWTMWSCNVRMHTDEVGWWLETDATNENMP